MYPPPESPKPCQRDARDAVLLIDSLIKLRVAEFAGKSPRKDDVEFIHRELTDYFLSTDSRSGIYVKGPND